MGGEEASVDFKRPGCERKWVGREEGGQGTVEGKASIKMLHAGKLRSWFGRGHGQFFLDHVLGAGHKVSENT